MALSRSEAFIESNPRFALTRASRPTIQRGQMTIVYEALEPFPSIHSLDDIVDYCRKHKYESTFKSETNIPRSILYHLNRLILGTNRVPAHTVKIVSLP
jgi:hypothetical protein